MTAAAEPLELRLPDRAGVEHRFVLRPDGPGWTWTSGDKDSPSCAGLNIIRGGKMANGCTAWGASAACRTATVGPWLVTAGSDSPESAVRLLRAELAKRNLTADDLLGVPA